MGGGGRGTRAGPTRKKKNPPSAHCDARATCDAPPLPNRSLSLPLSQPQIAACISAVRVNPSRYKADFAALSSCSYSSWIAGVTTPARMPLTWADKTATILDTAARKHAVDMATKNFFSHTGSNGLSPFQRARAAGYPSNNMGENIAAGFSTVRKAMVAWMCSSGHRDDLMSCSWTSVGSGYAYSATSTYKHYWVQDFGCNATSCYNCKK